MTALPPLHSPQPGVVHPGMPGIVPQNMLVVQTGQSVSSYAGDLLTGAKLSLSISQASTLALQFTDPHRTLLGSPLLNQAVTIDTGAYPPRRFTLVQVQKQGDQVTATFEDSVINYLRTQTGARSAYAGVITRDQFAAQMLDYAGIQPVLPLSWEQTATIPLTRGTAQNPDEDTWSCLTRLAGDVHYECFSDGTGVWFGPDSWLLGFSPTMTITEFTDEVDYIDFDFDVGKPVASATVSAYAATWIAPIGARVMVDHAAAATGDWIVSAISRDMYLSPLTVTMIQPGPALPEPAPGTTQT